MHKRWLVLTVALATGALVGCDIEDWGDSNRYKEDFHQSHALKSGGRLYVETFNGSIEVTGWDQETVDISGAKYASTQENLNALKIDVVATGDSIRVRTVRPSERRGNMGAKYTIKVPHKTALERLESSNGGVRVEDIEGPVRLRTSNGGLHVLRVRGDVEATTSNGGVELSDVEGRTVIKTSNGGIRAAQVRGSFDLQTSNGGIRAELKDTEPGRPVRLASSNGSIELTMDRLENDIEVSTSNSSITLRLPASIAATVKARTSNSSISSDFDVTARGEIGKNHLEGSIGGGGRLLDLSTSNGSIRLVKL
jgi:DUF4097 and DUF4098 domain-containing protein YvlB